MRRIDSKYHVDGDRIINTRTGVAIPEDEPLFLLRGKDTLAAPAILYYWDLCRSSGVRSTQREGVTNMVLEFEEFAARRAERMKLPD